MSSPRCVRTRSASILVVAAIALAPACAGSGAPQEPTGPRGRVEPGEHRRSLEVDGRERSYLLHVPPSYEPSRPWPVVLVYHGGATNAGIMVRFSGMSAKADEASFLAVYPEGTGMFGWMRTFNAGGCCGYAAKNDVDDVAFTRALLDDLAAVVHVDEDRVFATGMSNGGMMAYRLAAELSDRIAAIAPVGGPMAVGPGKPSRPVPVVHFHGTDDRLAPFKGGRGEGKSGWNFESVEASIGAWARANGCARDPKVEKLPDLQSDGTRVVRETYGAGRAGSEVVLYVIEGGGHTWPGGPMAVGALGATSREISANDLMWEFFQRHPRRP